MQCGSWIRRDCTVTFWNAMHCNALHCNVRAMSFLHCNALHCGPCINVVQSKVLNQETRHCQIKNEAGIFRLALTDDRFWLQNFYWSGDISAFHIWKQFSFKYENYSLSIFPESDILKRLTSSIPLQLLNWKVFSFNWILFWRATPTLADFPAVFFHICNFDICHEILTKTITKGWQ